jgi:GNAT superfamily N-acetyltransferase
MDEIYQVVSVDRPQESAWGIIGQAISEYNAQQAGDDNAQVLCFVLHSQDEEIVGGVIGAIYWDWFSLDLMWVRDDLRGRGYGGQLLARAEEEARRRGANQAFLDTFSFQAPSFYEQHGYQVFGELDEFPPGHKRTYMTKQL